MSLRPCKLRTSQVQKTDTSIGCPCLHGTQLSRRPLPTGKGPLCGRAWQRSRESLVHTDGAEFSGRAAHTPGPANLAASAAVTPQGPQISWLQVLKLARATLEARRGVGCRDSRAGVPATGSASPSSSSTSPRETAHKEIVQNKLHQILSSTSSQSDDDERDPLEEVPLENYQGVASFGRAVYEVLRLDTEGRTRRIYVKRRDLLRGIRLQPRDLRRIDPSLGSLTKPTPNIAIKENALLIHLGGVRAIMMADKCLLFDPDTVSSRKFLQAVAPRLQASVGSRAQRARHTHHDPEDADHHFTDDDNRPPFELECLEAAFLVAIGRLDAEMDTATRRMSAVLDKLPREINPVNLEELRRVKQALVELESKADQLRDMVEEIMDDEDEVRDLNLSSRPLREDRRRIRERERLERGMARSQSQQLATEAGGGEAAAGGRSPSRWTVNGSPKTLSEEQPGLRTADGRTSYDDAEEGYQEAEAALEEMEEAEEEEREVEEVEDLLEYYLQRAAATQSEAERLLDGARDLEESIGVSLSARRFEVNRLELTLSIGSFAAGLGAMIAGIFGMNLTSTFEASVIGFWSTTALIVFGCIFVVWALYSYTRRRRIL